jgi:YlmC/YmxH family sporulation protein
MERFCELRMKEVINIRDGKCLGCIDDLCLDVCSGQISAIVIPQGGRIASLFRRCDEIVVPWCKIIKMGDDVILVEWEGGQGSDKPRK